jgi:hypothetical protein
MAFSHLKVKAAFSWRARVRSDAGFLWLLWAKCAVYPEKRVKMTVSTLAGEAASGEIPGDSRKRARATLPTPRL